MRPEVNRLRKNVYDFIHKRIFAGETDAPVLEIGPMQERWTPVKDYYVNTREYFRSSGIEYIACDSDAESGCELLCDVLSLPSHVEQHKIGTIIALEVLEHVSEVWRTPEIFDYLLKPAGRLYLSVPYYFYRHAPFPDYWRISEDGLRLLFSPKFEIEIDALVTDDERKPLHYTVVGRKK